MKYWCLVLDNYMGEDEVFYFDNYGIALANFDVICKKYKNYDEFEKFDIDSCCWFDADYNEYSTYAYIEERELPQIFNEIIF